ncbi:hypothetical protein [Aureimonas populi]|uniref:DUF930 domain-containing protein n=1 Tax=Aureimonas populi TaxID=1701758 RepID=A0ABW5CFU9_9HYPH|nr:hypothetical protein [Aureimonas populi]
MLKRLSSAAMAACLALSGLQPALAADLRPLPEAAPMAVQPALVPACDDPRVLAQVEDQFEYGAVRVIPAPLDVAEFGRLAERAYFPKGGPRQIERRYCQGEATIANVDVKDGSPRTTVYYVIEHPMGFASIGWRAEGCFLGYDKWKIYGANCESLRRF